MFLRDLLYLVVLLFLSPWLVWRALRTGRYRHDLRAKLCGTLTPLPTERPAVWFHGVSVGEIHLLVSLVAAFRKRFPDYQIVISSTTDTGLTEARNRFAECTVIAFPFDFSWAVRATLSAIRPKLVILAESEMWPNFLAAAQEQRIPVTVINARMSPRSFARLKSVATLARPLLLDPITMFAVQSADYAGRLRQLGVSESRLVVTGSVKYDGATGDRDHPKVHELRRLLSLPADSTNPPLVLVAGSTHAPEEEIVLSAFQQLQAKYPALRLILVPRHPDRFEEVAKLVEKAGVSFVRRSRLVEPLSEPPLVLLLDTIGELGAAWGLADLGFTGGSLDGKRGGQSMIEPAGYGVPVVFGPHVWNFRDASKRLVEVGGAIQVKTAEELAPALETLIQDASLRGQLSSAALRFVRENQGATMKTLDVLQALLESNPSSSFFHSRSA